MAELPITGGFYISDSLPISHQECTNFYVNVVQSAGLARETLFGTPGIVQLATTGRVQQVNRGAWTKGGIPYFVNGDKLYSLVRAIDGDGIETFTTSALGTIEGSGRVSMADNGTQLMILVPGGKGYIYNESDGTPFQEITDLDFTANGNPQHVVFIDGYFACTTDSKKWTISSLNDGLTWSALDFGSAESDPDVIVAPVVVNNQIYITGSITTEGFRNIGGAGFPFQRNNVFLDKGCKAPFSIIHTNQTFYMIGAGENESPAIWRFNGSNFQKVSTTAIDSVLHGLSDMEIEEAFSWYYAQKGAYFIGFNAGNRCFVYDIISQRWHERKSTAFEETGRFRVNSMVSAYGRILVADNVDGRIGSLETETYTEYSENIRRVFSTQPFANMDGFFIPTLELTMESGTGNDAAPDPKVSMAISRDGKTFGYEKTRRIGKIGNYQQRIFWRRNGRIPRFAVLRFRLSDPIKPVVIKLEAA